MSKMDICIRSARLRHQLDELLQLAYRAGENIGVVKKHSGVSLPGLAPIVDAHYR